MKLSTALLEKRNQTHHILHIDVKIFTVPEAKKKKKGKTKTPGTTGQTWFTVLSAQV